MAKILKGKTQDWEIVIGLEVHAQVISQSKLFSSALTHFGAAPNTQVSFLDMAMPGMLPVLNKRCVEQAVRTGLAMNCAINKTSIFARKNYFYADLPQGYQISQFDKPIVGEGIISIDLPDGTSKDVRIERIHLEQDAGKSIHDQHPDKTYVDLNRAGVALMEIVSMPDMRCEEEAAAYITKLRSILRYVGSCDGNMQEGSLRADINVSVRPIGGALGTRCELKNINSIKFIKQAVQYEARRQIEILENGGSITQETRLFDPNKGETRSMRSKENAHDYRYFPDPDLPALVLDDTFIEEQRKTLPELPDHKKKRFSEEYGLNPYDISVLIDDIETANYFEDILKASAAIDPKMAANWVISELFAQLNKHNLTLTTSSVRPQHLAELISLIADQTISGKIAKDVFEEMFATHKSAAEIVETKGLKQITDPTVIENMINDLITANPDQIQKYKEGKTNIFGWFVGQTLKQSGGKANPQLVNEILTNKLKSI